MKKELLKEALSAALDLYEDIEQVLEDGKISAVEWPAVGIAMTQVPGVVNSGRIALAELRSGLDPDMAVQITEEIALDFDLNDDEVEERIEDILQYMARIYRWVMDGIDLFRDIKVDFFQPNEEVLEAA